MDVAVVGPVFHGYNDSIVRALESLHVHARSLPFSEPGFASGRQRYRRFESEVGIGESGRPGRWVRRIGRTVLFPTDSVRPEVPALRACGKRLITTLKQVRPDILLVIKGTSLLPETLLGMSRSLQDTRRVLWAQDSVRRFPSVLAGIKEYDSVFVFEPTDVEFLRERGVSARYLPMGYDPLVYWPLPDARTQKPWSVSFVGEARPERVATLEALGRRLGDGSRGIRFGVFGPKWNRFWKDLKPPAAGGVQWDVHLGDVTPADVNRIYNRSLLCLNLHHAQSREGLNPRTFEIPGAGGLQIVERKPALVSMFSEGKEVLVFDGLDNLASCIEPVLEDPDSFRSVARNGHERALRDHTLTGRMEEMLAHV